MPIAAVWSTLSDDFPPFLDQLTVLNVLKIVFVSIKIQFISVYYRLYGIMEVMCCTKQLNFT